MDIQNRLLRVLYSKPKQCLYASDVRGRVHKFDLDLNLLQSSPVVSYDRPVNSICLSDKYIFTKDRFGSIGKWDIDTLQPIDFLDGKLVCDARLLEEDEEPAPTPNRGIAIHNGRLYTNNGYNQIVILDQETFEIIDIKESPSPVFFDCICTDHPEVHAMTDVRGNIFIGNVESMEFPIQKQIDTMVVHAVVYDKKHDRFWTTQDGGLGDKRFCHTGVTTIEKDGSGFNVFPVSNEDNEFIEFTEDYNYLITGGFNGKVFVFDNTNKEFNLKKILGPFEFQIIHGCVVSEDQIYILLQTGDIIRINGQGKEVCRAAFNNACVWILEPHPDDESIIYAGTDYGVSILSYRIGRFGSVKVQQLQRHEHGFGIVKDVKPFADNSYVFIARKGYVVKASGSGAIQWQRQVLGVPKSVSLNKSKSKCMVSTEEGTVWEIDTLNGEVLNKINVGSPSYASAYTADGRRVASADKGQKIHVYDGDSDNLLGTIDGFRYRVKRIFRGRRDSFFAAGPDGLFELDLENYGKSKSFGAHMVSTKENGVYCDGHVYVGGYGYQLATYNYETGDLLDLEETLPDYTKAFAARVPEDGIPILLVGGRGGFLNIYRLIDGIPNKVREFYVR